MKKTDKATQKYIRKDLPDIRPGDTVKVYQTLKEKDKERTQIFEGTVIALKHNREIGATITVRKIVDNIGVERIFPLHLPTLKKIDIVRSSKVRRAKLYFLRHVSGKKAKLKRKKRVRKPEVESKSSEDEEKPAAETTAATAQAPEEQPVEEKKPEETPDKDQG
jgi:large subunit ribosomal protein L19